MFLKQIHSTNLKLSRRTIRHFPNLVSLHTCTKRWTTLMSFKNLWFHGFCFLLFLFFFSFFTHNLTINAEELKMSFLLNENNYSSWTHLKTDSFYRLYCEKNCRKYRENAIDSSRALWCLFVKNIYSLLSSHFIQNCVKVPPFS